MKKTTQFNPEYQHNRGTVLLTVTIIVFMIAAAAAVTMKLALSDLRQNQQRRKTVQSRQIAESAAQVGVSRLNNGLLEKYDLGKLGNTNKVNFTEKSSEIPFDVLSVPTGDMSGNPSQDGFDNDGDGKVDEPDEAGQMYTGGSYRISLTEWSDENGIDDDNDGVMDESDEDYTRVSSKPVNFDIEGDWIVPQDDFKIRNLSVIAAIPDTDNPDSGAIDEYHAPVTAQIIIGKDNPKVYEPWGPFDDPHGADIHSHLDEAGKYEFAPDKTFEGGTAISLKVRSWKRQLSYTGDGWDFTYVPLRTEKPDESANYEGENHNLEPKQDGDVVPGYEGADDQASPEDALPDEGSDDIIDEKENEKNRISTKGSNGVLLAELTDKAKKGKDGEIKNKDENGVDFQDFVAKIEFDTFPKGGRSTHKRRFTMDVTGTYGGYTTTLGSVVTATPVTNGQYGVFASKDLTIKENSIVDSFNSNQGHHEDQKTSSAPNGSKYARRNGNVGANGAVTLNSNSVVMGRVDYRSTFFNHPTAHVHKQKESDKLDESLKFKKEEFPSRSTISQGSLTVSGTGNTIGKENSPRALEFSEIKLQKGASLTIKRKTFVHITGSFQAKPESQLIVEGPTTIRVDQDFVTGPKFEFQAVTGPNPIEVYVGNKLEFKSEARVYTTTKINGDPSPKTENLRWFVGNTFNDGSVTFLSNMKNPKVKKPPLFQGIIKAPFATVKLMPQTQMYGAIIGGNVTVFPGAGIHYDESLDKFCNKFWKNCEYRATINSTWVKSRGK